MRPIDRLVKRAGSQAAIARALGLFNQNVQNWVVRGNIPADHCAKLEKLYGLRCEDMRPDFKWERDGKGRVVHYLRIRSPKTKAA